LLCPGDTATVYLSGAQTYLINSGDILELINDSTFTVNQGVDFIISGQTESAEGCVNSILQTILIPMVDQPEATLLPSNGVVCPGAFVELTTTPGEVYTWVGPGGNVVSTNQTFSTNQPGQYSCIVEIGQCVIESNIVTIAQYFEPYILYLPEPDPCNQTPVSVEIVTPFPEGVTWDPQLNFTGVSGVITEYGSYTVQAIACGITTQVEIVLPVSNLTTSIVAAAPVLCAGEETTVTATTNGSGIVWSTGAVNTNVITVNATGTYAYTAVDDLGCTSTASVLVQVFDPQPPVTAANAVACFNEPLTLSADADFNVFWTSDAAGEAVLANGQSYTIPAVDGAFTVYVFQQQQQCISEPTLVSVDVSIASLPVEIAAGDSLCLGGDFSLAVVNPAVDSYLWQTANGEVLPGGVTFSIDNAQLTDSGWYTATAQDAFCSSSSDSVQIIVFTPEPVELALAPDALCEGDVLTLFAPTAADSYSWATPNGFVNGPDLLVTNLTQADAGDYLLSVSGAECTYVFAPHTLYVGTYPDFELDADLPECVGPALRITVEGDYDEFEWSTGDTDDQIWIIEPGTYSLTASNYPGCATTRDIDIVEIDCDEAFFNVFTPNYDGVNDYVDFALHPVKFQRVYIYNRWGTLIEELQAPRLQWYGGSSSGEDLSDGVYYWVGQGITKELHGSIYIRR
jgi:gliding motility-associated-like protein